MRAEEATSLTRAVHYENWHQKMVDEGVFEKIRTAAGRGGNEVSHTLPFRPKDLKGLYDYFRALGYYTDWSYDTKDDEPFPIRVWWGR